MRKLAITFLYTSKDLDGLNATAYMSKVLNIDYDWETQDGYLKLLEYLKESSNADNVIPIWTKELKVVEEER